MGESYRVSVSHARSLKSIPKSSKTLIQLVATQQAQKHQSMATKSDCHISEKSWRARRTLML